jgi:hypothetical protein
MHFRQPRLCRHLSSHYIVLTNAAPCTMQYLGDASAGTFDPRAPRMRHHVQCNICGDAKHAFRETTFSATLQFP